MQYIKDKRGISLIVLVITIIVMIILSTVTIISLNSTNIIDKANEAVNNTNLKQVQNIANMAWMEWYLGDEKTKSKLDAMVEDAMQANKVDTSKYDIEVTEQEVNVSEIHDEYILNKLNGNSIESHYTYKFLEGKQVKSLTIIHAATILCELNDKNNWQTDNVSMEFLKIGFGENTELNVEKNTLYFMFAPVSSNITETLILKFKFTDGSVSTDEIICNIQSNTPAE